MTPEEKALLERTANMVAENNAILKSIQRSNRWSITLRLLYWAVIIVLGFAATYLIQPYANTLMSAYGQIGDIQNLLKQ